MTDAKTRVYGAQWSDTWNFPIWFPLLALDLPPHGADFGCHDGTTCVLNFTEVYNAATGQTNNVASETDVAYNTLTHDGRGPQDGACEALGSRAPGEPGKYLCPIKGGMLGLSQAMLKTGSVASCGVCEWINGYAEVIPINSTAPLLPAWRPTTE